MNFIMPIGKHTREDDVKTERNIMNLHPAPTRQIGGSRISPRLQLQKLCIAFTLVVAEATIIFAQVPKATLDNGVIHATVDLPNAVRGSYRGTRFDWSGVISDLTFAGHSYYGPWFTKKNANVADFIYDGPNITAGNCSAITGPVEEFVTEDGSGLGFRRASPQQTFVKIGLGTLRKPDNQRYSPYRNYEIVDHGTWKVRRRSMSIEFTQRIVDESSGYGYLYTKVLRLDPWQPILVIDHSLKNIGRLSIDTKVYDHNFLTLDHATVGPDLSISFSFAVKPGTPVNGELGAVEGNRISYRKQLKGSETFTAHIGGFGTTSKDYDIRIENSRLGAGMRITGDKPLIKEELWSIRSIVAVEPFIHLIAARGKTIHWSYTYRYYTLTQKR